MSHRIRQSSCAFLLLLGSISGVKAQTTYFTDLALFSKATNTNLVEDFEAIRPRETSLASFTHNGNTYTGIADPLYIAAPGFTEFQIPTIPSSVLTANGDEDFTVDFGTPTPVVGFDTYTNIYGPAIIRIYGASGLLDTYSLAQDPTKIGFFGVEEAVPITSIRWTTTNGAVVDTGIDNIRVGGVAAVPEPSSGILFLAGGLAGMGLFLHCCRK